MKTLTRLTAAVAAALGIALTLLAQPSGAAAAVDDPAASAAQYHREFVLFRSANMSSPDKLSSGVGFHSFRIPAVVTTSTGRLLAFAEGRRHNNLDYGDINLVYKRTRTTTDNGADPADWESLREVVGSGNGTWGNPTPVVDGNTIYLFLSWNAGDRSLLGNQLLPDGTRTKPVDATEEGRRRLFLTTSTDDGNTWSTPRDMTSQLTPNGWAWDAVGPGNGIRMRSGQLVIPAHGRNIIGTGTPGNRTWSYQLLNGAGSEGTIAQTPDGNLYRNDRPLGSADYRLVGRGTLNGFGAFSADTALPDPLCQGSVLSYNLDSPARTIFLNSASTSSRRAMRVRISYDDDARTYTYSRALGDAPVSGAGYEGGYSSMTKTADYRIGALVEADFFNDGTGGDSYRSIVWRRFNLSWILNGPDNQ
ncbi:exo-alpha-sialidase [Streptomyces litchfieldiae]|uniref:exo-alpha-sialidase n=1 Tax=Streptomyces litchfieldiae TaxID=3075543 RepID=A0ABU2MZ12_9ACTN|nr:exo-alpha-sialidase [Streptomyces sp. DSM 44938]MDT0346895.1 exo-alpha-sialidase [Streptomyces sp. DSM 44938]